MKKLAISASIICALGITAYIGLNSGKDDVYTEEPVINASSPKQKEKSTIRTIPKRETPLKPVYDSRFLASDLIQELTNPENPDYVKLGFKAAAISKMKLSDSDFVALSNFLKLSPSTDKSHLGLHALKDMMIVMMIKNGAFIEDLGDTFNDILADPHQHPVMIDYVSQYIPEYFEKRWSGKDDQEQEKILKSLYKLLNRSDDSVAGTALSALTSIEDKYPMVDQSLIKKKAFEMAEDSSLAQASRSQALRYLGSHPSEKGGVILKQVAFDETNPVMMRMIAVRSLADYMVKAGEPSEELTKRINKEILNNSQSDKRLLAAARAAHSILNITKLHGDK